MLAIGLFAFGVFTPQPASAETTALVCPGTAHVGLDPGVTLAPVPQDVSGTVAFGTEVLDATPCTSVTGEPFVGARGTLSGTASGLSCLPTPLGLLGAATGTVELDWYDATDQVVGQSTWNWTLTISLVGVTTTGPITSGDLAGSTLVFQSAPTGFSGTCGILSPVTSVSLTGVATALQV